MRKLICIIIIASGIMTASLSGCAKNDNGNDNGNGNGNNNGGEIRHSETQHHYKTANVADVALGTVLDLALHEDRVIVAGFSQEGATTTVKAISYDMSGKLIGETILSTSDSDAPRAQPSAAAIDDDGDIWVLYNDHNPETYLYQESVLERFDGSGNHMESLSIGSLNSDTFFNMSLIVEGGRFYVSSPRRERSFTAVFDESGTPLFELDRINDIFKLLDGRIVALRSDIAGKSVSFVEVDALARSAFVADEVKLNADMDSLYAYYVAGNAELGVLECTQEGIFGLNPDEATRTKLIDWLNQGINHATSDFYRYVAMAGGDIFCLRKAADGISLIKFSETDAPPEVVEKRTLTLGTLYDASDMIRYTVAEFNARSQGYEIQVKEYQGDSNQALNALNLDIIAGNAPDIMFIAPTMVLESYVAKGLFADLYEFMDADPDVSREDYIQNILNLLETDGKLYAIADAFRIDTVVGGVSDVGTDMGWTWADFTALMAKQPAGTIPMAMESRPISRETFVAVTLMARVSSFVDYGAGKCYFDTPDFYALLETAKVYPEKVGNDETLTPADYRDGNPLLLLSSIYYFGANRSTIYEAAYFGEEITYIGYPTDDGTNGSICAFQNLMGISAQSTAKEGAWEYIKYIITDYQHIQNRTVDGRPVNTPMDGFPIRLTALEEYAHMAMNPYYGSEGENTTDDGTKYRAPREKDVKKIYDLIYSLDSRTNSLLNVYQIVMEVVPDYWSGLKTAEEVGEIIQNRVSTYLAERE